MGRLLRSKLKASRVVKRSSTSISGVLKLFIQTKSGPIGLGIISIYIIMALWGQHIRPLDTTPNPLKIYLPPSLQHPLGTDNLGRDTLSFIVNGARDVLYISFLAAIISTFLAAFVGSLAGLVGGKVDSALMYITDTILTIPQFPLMAMLSGMVRLSDVSLAAIMGVLSWPALARAIRSQVLSIREREFIEAARILDLGTRHIVLVEIMPNIMPYIVVNFALAMIYSLYNYVGLVFLGFVPFKVQNWGVMLNQAWVLGAVYNEASIWWILAPIITITIFEIGLIMLARSLETVLNPRLRG